MNSPKKQWVADAGAIVAFALMRRSLPWNAMFKL
jgi:hypothetical protein